MSKFPTNNEIKIGAKVRAELFVERGTGKLKEGTVIEKNGFLNNDRNGCLVTIKIQDDTIHLARVHVILDEELVKKNRIIEHIEILPGENYQARRDVIELLTQSEEFIWLFLGYFRHNHFDVFKEVIENNRSIKEIKIITIIQRKDQKNLFELLLENAKEFKRQYSEIDFQIKILNDKKKGRDLHNRYYFTKDRQYDFIDFDQMKNSQRTEIQLLDQSKFKENSERDFLQYWNLDTALDIFNKGNQKKILEYFD